MFDNNYIFKIKISYLCHWILILFLSLSVQYGFANIVFDDELNSNGTVEHVEKNKKNESLNKQEQKQGKVEFDEDFDDEKKISNKSIKTHDLQISSPNNKKNKSTKNNNDDELIELIEYINNDIDIDEEIKKYESLSDELILLNVKHAKPVLIEYDNSIKKGNEFNQKVESDTKQNILTNINFFLVKLYFLGLLFCTSIIYCIKVIYDIFSTRKKFKKYLQSLY